MLRSSSQEGEELANASSVTCSEDGEVIPLEDRRAEDMVEITSSTIQRTSDLENSLERDLSSESCKIENIEEQHVHTQTQESKMISDDDSSREEADEEEEREGESDTDNLLSEREPREESNLHFKDSTVKRKIVKLFIHGSFYVVGLCVLIGGGVSSRYHPHVDPEEYSNCSSFDNSSSVRTDMAIY